MAEDKAEGKGVGKGLLISREDFLKGLAAGAIVAGAAVGGGTYLLKEEEVEILTKELKRYKDGYRGLVVRYNALTKSNTEEKRKLEEQIKEHVAKITELEAKLGFKSQPQPHPVQPEPPSGLRDA